MSAFVNRRAELRVSGNVDVVGNRLRFKAVSVVFAVMMSVFAVLIESVAGIKLHRGHIGITTHFDTRFFAVRDGVRFGYVAPRNQYETMIVTAAFFQIGIVGIDIPRNTLRRGKIERRAGGGAKFAAGNQGIVGRRDIRRIDLQKVIRRSNVIPFSVEIEIRVIREIDRRFLSGTAR